MTAGTPIQSGVRKTTKMSPSMKDKLVSEGLYDRETCDVMSDAEAETLWQLHQEIGQAFDAVVE
jgi:hypothetical protein